MRFLVFCTLVFISISCSNFYQCVEGEGEIVSKIIELDSFSKIDLSCSVNVEIIQGSQQSISVRAQDNLIDLIDKAVTQSEWKIDFTENVCYDKPIKVKITLPEFERLEINGSGNIQSAGVIKGKDLKIEINGSGNVIIDLEVKDLKTNIEGSGDVKCSGRANSHKISIDGSGDLNAQDLESNDCRIEIDGSGDCLVFVTDHLEIEIYGSGNVIYKGNPKSVKTNTHGTGSIKQK